MSSKQYAIEDLKKAKFQMFFFFELNEWLNERIDMNEILESIVKVEGIYPYKKKANRRISTRIGTNKCGQDY